MFLHSSLYVGSSSSSSRKSGSKERLNVLPVTLKKLSETDKNFSGNPKYQTTRKNQTQESCLENFRGKYSREPTPEPVEEEEDDIDEEEEKQIVSKYDLTKTRRSSVQTGDGVEIRHWHAMLLNKQESKEAIEEEDQPITEEEEQQIFRSRGRRMPPKSDLESLNEEEAEKYENKENDVSSLASSKLDVSTSSDHESSLTGSTIYLKVRPHSPESSLSSCESINATVAAVKGQLDRNNGTEEETLEDSIMNTKISLAYSDHETEDSTASPRSQRSVTFQTEGIQGTSETFLLLVCVKPLYACSVYKM